MLPFSRGRNSQQCLVALGYHGIISLVGPPLLKPIAKPDVVELSSSDDECMVVDPDPAHGKS